MTWLIQGLTVGYAGMLQATQRDQQQGQAATCRAELGALDHNHRTRHRRQAYKAALVGGGCTQQVQRERRSLPPSLLAWGEAGTKVHQAGAAKRGGESSSEPAEGVGRDPQEHPPPRAC